MAKSAHINHVRRASVDRVLPPPPPDETQYLAALEDPDMIEIVAKGHFMRRDTWERYNFLFPAYDDARKAADARRAAYHQARFTLAGAASQAAKRAKP